MKKLIAIAVVMIFVFAATGVYACGEKSSSAKASKASNNTECGSKATKASTVESNADKAEVTTADYKANTVDAKNYCVKKGDDAKASVMKTDASGGCHWKGEASEARVMKADAMSGKANCPVSANCPAPCNNEAKANKMKAENSTEEVQPAQVSAEASSEVYSQ